MLNTRNDAIRSGLHALRADLIAKLDDHAWRNCRKTLRRELARIQHDLDVLAFSNVRQEVA